MTDISSNDLNAHYTTQTKVEKPVYVVASAPQNLPKYHTFNDKDATNKFRVVNRDIYNGSKDKKQQPFKNFLKVYGLIVATILAVAGIRRIF